MDKIKEIFEVELETITPVHIGSGEEYINNIEVIDNKVLNINKLMRCFYKNKKKLSELSEAIENKSLSDFIKQNIRDIPDDVFYKFDNPELGINNNIKKHIRTGTGEVYIPGSSIKGAIRTSIIKYLSKENDGFIKKKLDVIEKQYNINPKYADNSIVKRLLGNDPQKNFMRIIQISDTNKIDKVTIEKVQVINSTRMKSKLIFYEMIPAGVKTRFTFSIDKYLDREKNKAEIPQNNIKLQSIWELISEISNITLDYHLDYSMDKSEINKAYKNIKKNFNNLDDNETLIDLGAGIGWVGTTGNIIEDLINDDLRKKLRLAPNHLKFQFPKTRRLVYLNDNWLPPGWVKLKFLSLEEAKKIRKKEKIEREAKKLKLKEEQEKIEKDKREREEKERIEKERLEALTPEERLKEEIKKEIKSGDSQRIGTIVKKCISETKEKEVFIFLRDQLQKIDEWKPKGGNNKKKKMKKRNEEINNIIGD